MSISFSSDTFSLPYIAFQGSFLTRRVTHLKRGRKKQKYEERKERKKEAKKCNIDKDQKVHLEICIMGIDHEK